MSKLLVPCSFAGMLFLCACSGAQQVESSGDEISVAGVFHKGFEAITLQPCGTDTLWWVTGKEDFFFQTNAFAQEVAEKPIGRGGYRVFFAGTGRQKSCGRVWLSG